jgi:hypothetical protein
LLLATGTAYVTAQRPRIIAGDAAVTIRNPLRDHRIGWAGVTKVDLADLLRVHCAQGGQHRKVVNAWAVPYSRRRQFAAEAKARRPSAPVPSTAEAEAEKIVRVLTDRATAAQAELTGSEPLRSTWSGRAVAALVIPALILLTVSLI